MVKKGDFSSAVCECFFNIMLEVWKRWLGEVGFVFVVHGGGCALK